ncbi:MAG: hypothetical protein KTR17_11550 [Cellvibrionaceae bacterium]|nr:hypothetical protein [Cellvibrionaceae bacterium]
MTKALIVCANTLSNGVGSVEECLHLEQQLCELGEAPIELTIDPLSTDWHSEQQVGRFRTGCGPIEALARAKTLIENGCNAVVISGEDLLKSQYSPEQRLSLMAIYGEDYPLTAAYTELAEHFIERHNSTPTEFKHIAQALFDNYLRSYQAALGEAFHADQLPDAKWYNFLNPLFRGVDCANPLVDFTGRLLICSEHMPAKLHRPRQTCSELRGVGIARANGDGRDYIGDISAYQHLKQAFEKCCDSSGVDINRQLKAQQLLLEAYTCCPVVPMAFLLHIGAVASLQAIPEFLETQPITVTGGMNLARAAWNCTALNGLIAMHQCLINGDKNYGLVHGNGGLGYRQGLALLSK